MANAPSAFTNAVLAAAQYLEAHITTSVTINLSIGWGEEHSQPLGTGALGATQSALTNVSYGTLRSALAAHATSAADAAALASLPTTAPVSGGFWTTTAQGKALGLIAANNTATDAYIGFSSTAAYTFSDTNGVAAGTYDFNGVALHEMTEALGRMMLTGTSLTGSTPDYTLMDLFHYSSAGVRDFSSGTAGYFSVNGGVTSLGALNTQAGADAGDLASPTTPTTSNVNAFDAYASPGLVAPVTANDLTMMDALGWTLASPSQPTGIAVAAVTGTLAASQGLSGLTSGATLAAITQTGGASGDSYTYALGGSGAGSFVLSTASNVATLAVGAGGLAGGGDGKLYSLTVTATDSTTGQSTVAHALDVIVGSGGSDTVSVATLSAGIGAATPTLIYGLGGSDTINGSGMTGDLWFASGAGADSMTGGFGTNTYMYSSVSDSTASAMDTITNFNVPHDVIDLSGLGMKLTVAGSITGSTLAAGSIGWQTSGADTYVYVNASGAAESLTATDMKIALAGSLNLGSGNFAHL